MSLRRMGGIYLSIGENRVDIVVRHYQKPQICGNKLNFT